MVEKKQEENIKSQGTDWKEKIEGYLGEFAKSLAGGFVERIKTQLHELYIAFQKNAVGGILMLIGFIFALIAMVIFINDLVKISNGIGYAVVGIAAIFLGLIIIKK